MPEPTSQITIISDLLKRDPAYREVIDQLEERLYNRYMVYLADKPRFNTRTQAIPKPYLNQIISLKNTIELNKLAKKYNFTQEQRDKMPAILWKIFYREAELKNLPQMLNSELNMNNIHFAYLASIDIANIYMPISDFLGDVGMVIKRWQYEMPAETESRIMPSPTAKIAQPITEAAPLISATTPPPIRPSNQSESRITNQELRIPQEMPEDKPIPKVQETLSRIATASNRINDQIQKTTPEQIQQITPSQELPPQSTQQIISPQTTSHASDLEPEYLPDEPAKQTPQATPETPPANKANVIDLKNF